jgi:regulator of CtrA degradation
MMGEAATAFFEKTYEEATDLLVEARDYIAIEEKADLEQLIASDRLRLSRETTRLTARLTTIMAWLLARKAVLAGELTQAEAAQPPYLLERNKMLADGDPDAYENLPELLSELMERSHRLYVRVTRLDELVQSGIGGQPPRFYS